MLRTTASDNANNWPSFLPAAYRMTTHSVAGTTPNMAMLGREVLIPATLTAQPPDEPSKPVTPYVTSFRSTHLKSVVALPCETWMHNCTTLQESCWTQYGAITFNFSKCLPGTLSACSCVYADKFTACLQNVRLLNACTRQNVSCVHVRSARPSRCPSKFQNSAAQSCFL